MHFHVKLNSVKEKHVPTLDDDFATTVSDLKTIDELQARVRENVLRQKQNDANRELTDKFVKEAVAQSHIEMPPQLVNQQIHVLEENLGQRLKQQKLTVDQYLSITGKSHEEFHEDLRPQAEEQLRNQLVLVEIAKAEGVKVEDAEIETEIDQFVEQYTQNAPADTLDQQKQRLRELYSNQQMRENISNDLFSRKLGERLIELSTGIKPSSPQMQAVNASEAELDLELKTDPNLATEASEAKEELTQGAIEEEDAQA
jgi:trigger factor